MTRSKRLEDYKNLYIWVDVSPAGKTSRPYKQEDLDAFVMQHLLCDVAETLDRLYLLIAAKANEKQS